MRGFLGALLWVKGRVGLCHNKRRPARCDEGQILLTWEEAPYDKTAFEGEEFAVTI
jgi:hypothetical protein